MLIDQSIIKLSVLIVELPVTIGSLVPRHVPNVDIFHTVDTSMTSEKPNAIKRINIQPCIAILAYLY